MSAYYARIDMSKQLRVDESVDVDQFVCADLERYAAKDGRRVVGPVTTNWYDHDDLDRELPPGVERRPGLWSAISVAETESA